MVSIENFRGCVKISIAEFDRLVRATAKLNALFTRAEQLLELLYEVLPKIQGSAPERVSYE